MKSKKATKRALLSSALSLVLCFSMLLGTTFAWFTDEAKTGVNTIVSGTLDVDLQDAAGATLEGQSLSFVNKEGSADILWEPGVTFRTEGFQIVNKGNLALKYKVVINGISDGSYAELLDVIDFYVTTDKTDADAAQRISLDDLVSNYTPLAPKGADPMTITTVSGNDGVNSVEKTFTNVDDKDGPFYLFGHMDEDAGNEYQDKQLTGLGITVYATQVEAEYDSFDNEYDEDSAPNMVPVAKVERILEPVTVTSALSGKDYTLDTAYTFSTMETYDAAELSPYAEWNADFVITFDKDVVKETAGLAGQYDTWSPDWLAFEIPVDVVAGEPVRLLAFAGIGMTYEELCLLVKEFDCGAFDVDNQNAGTTMTVELRLFETQKAATGSGSTAVETGKYKTIAAYTYTFPNLVKTAEGLKNALAKGGEIKLAADINMGSETLTVAKDVVLDLNGYVLNGACDAGQGHLFMVNNGAALDVKDSSAAQTGKISYAQGTSNIGWAIDLEGKLNLYSGTIELTGDSWSIGYAVDVRPNAWGTNYAEDTVFHMYGGKIISSDGAIRVASSSSDTYGNIVASFIMDGGVIDADWDGIFVQQSNAAYDTLNVTINGGTITSALSPIRVYGPAATSVNAGTGKPMTIAINGGALSVKGTPDATRTWHTLGKIVIGGGMTLDDLNQYATITIA